MLTPIARGLSLFLGGFTLLNLAGDLRSRGTGANIWWIDFPFVPRLAAIVLLIMIAIALLVYAIAPRVSGVRRAIASVLLPAAIAAARMGTMLSIMQAPAPARHFWAAPA